MNEKGIDVENQGNVTGQTIINIQSMSGNIGVPQAVPVYVPQTTATAIRPILLNAEFYNFFVIFDEDFNKGRFRIDVSRSITEYTEPEITARFTPLDSDKIEQILRFPSLFMNECAQSAGSFAPNQVVYFGLVAKIKKQAKEYVVEFQKLGAIPLEPIMKILRDLDIRTDYRGYGEMTRTHWAIKEVDLIQELRISGIDVLGMNK